MMAILDRKNSMGLDRRSFLATSVQTGLVMGFSLALPDCGGESMATEAGQSPKLEPTIWFEIDLDGNVLVNITKAEMGQHVGTALARIVADELGADWSKVRIVHVDTDPRWGIMITGGSWSVFSSFHTLSQAGAAGRMVLVDAAAALLGVAAEKCVAADGRVTTDGRSLSFAEIVRGGDIERKFSAEELAALPIKAPSQRKLIGQEAQALDIPVKARGDAVYGLDVELPGMVYARPVLPPTRYGSQVIAVDESAAKSIEGYSQHIVLEDPSEVLQGWVLAIADSFYAAKQAADALQVEWTPGPTAKVAEADLIAEGRQLCATQQTGTLIIDDGNIEARRREASETLTSVYTTASAMHFAMEPVNAVAEFANGELHIHSGNQWQSLSMPTLAKVAALDESKITIHQYFLGGGFGRRLFGDYMIPSILAAKALGKPVKTVFTREDDCRFDCIRSSSVQQFDATLNATGEFTGLEHALAAGWPSKAMAPFIMLDGLDGTQADPFSYSGADHWYTLPNHRVRAINNELAHRTFLPGWLRSVGPGWTGWGVESFMDELAFKTGVDPIEFRLRLLDGEGKNAGKTPESVGGAQRLAATLRRVREQSNWGSELPAGEGLGVAVSAGQERTMPTWVACVAHIAVADDGSIKVKKIYTTIDCGTVVHPDGALAQAEGATLWGLSIALYESAPFGDGQVTVRNLDTYRPLRMADVPELDIQFVECDEIPTGMGEPPMTVVAPAIGNAVFATTGKRLRDLPITLNAA